MALLRTYTSYEAPFFFLPLGGVISHAFVRLCPVVLTSGVMYWGKGVSAVHTTLYVLSYLANPRLRGVRDRSDVSLELLLLAGRIWHEVL